MSTVPRSNRLAIVFLLLVQLACPVEGQISHAGRWERVSADNYEKFKVANLGETGLMLYRRTAGTESDQLELVRLDTALNEKWKGFLPIDRGLALHRVQALDGKIYFLMRLQNYVGGDFSLITVRLDNGSYTNSSVKNLIPFNPTEFLVTPKAALIGGYFNYRPLVLHYSFFTGRAKVLPGFFNSPGELNQLKAYDDGSIDIIVSARNLEKRRALWIRNYDPDGELIKTVILQPDENRNLIFGQSMKLPGGEQVVAGVYGRFTEYSRGIFVAGVDPTGEYTISYYNFAQLENFFSYMKVKRQQRVKGRIERKTIRGKKVKFNYRVLIHQIIPYQDQYIMTGEAFYPRYIYPNNYGSYRAYSYSRSYPGTNVSPFLRPDLIFDGYQYTHAVVIGFDKSGKLRWDNSFEINDVRSMQLEQFVKVKPEKDRIILMYLFENAIRSKIIRGSEVLEGKTQEQVRPVAVAKKGAKEDQYFEGEQLDYWHQHYFFAYGVERVQRGLDKPAQVYYINKISYK